MASRYSAARASEDGQHPALRHRARLGELDVEYPQLPAADTPDLDTWVAALDDLVTGAVAQDAERPVTLVAHSLATSLWLTRLARGGSTGRITRLALVAIPSPSVLRSTSVAPFVDHPARIDSLPGIEQRLFEGEGDEYSPRGVRADYAIDSSIPVERVAGGAHLTPASGFGQWPRILDWVLDFSQPPS